MISEQEIPKLIMEKIQEWIEASFLEIEEQSLLFFPLPQPQKWMSIRAFLATFRGRHKYDWISQFIVLFGLQEDGDWHISRIPTEIMQGISAQSQQFSDYLEDIGKKYFQGELENGKREILLKRTCSSGITLQIEDKSEGAVYDEIFMEGEYDLPIHLAIESGETTLNILDLGANSGFFALRVLDLTYKNYKSFSGINMILVEGSKIIYDKLYNRLKEVNKENYFITLLHGLVGKRGGVASFYEKDFHAASSIYEEHFKGSPGPAPTNVSFIDISNVFNKDKIDILKCDIEGSELMFLCHYSDLIERVKYAVFEFHPHLCDINECFRLLSNAGFRYHMNLRISYPPTVFFWK